MFGFPEFFKIGVTMHYELVRAIGDLDVFDVIPNHAALWLASLAGEGSALHKRHKLYVQIASVATLPCEYAGRLVEVFSDAMSLGLRNDTTSR